MKNGYIMLAYLALAAGCGKPEEAASVEPVAAAAAVTVSAESRGLAWLAAQQREDGLFSSEEYPAMTALAMQALAASGDAQYAPNVDRAVAAILRYVQPDGGIYKDIPGRKGGGLSSYNTSICMTALASLKRPDLTPVLLNARAFIAGTQELEDAIFKGGFGYDRAQGRAYADITNTSFALEAMHATAALEDNRPASQGRVDIDWDAALAFLEGVQNGADTGEENAGGFFYTHNDPKGGSQTNSVATADGETEQRVILRSYGSVTYEGMLAMIYCQLDRTDPRVVSALDWATRYWTLDENSKNGDQGLYFYYNVLARALAAAKVPVLKSPTLGDIHWQAALTQKLHSLQHPDGYWVNDHARFMENDPILVTAYTLLALFSAQ
ncbi:MAG: terpene cyclase/mutase family protein [Kiritimatiellaeota bacterium]|nr:terpene cyclase/mutase family protein [Kiritimatiellota bacterium]